MDLEIFDEYVHQNTNSLLLKHALQQAPYSSAIGISLPPGLEGPVQVSKEKALELYMGVVNKLAEAKLQKEAEEEKKRET